MAGINAISTVARTVWMVVRDLNVTTGRMLLPIKKNRSMNHHGFAYFHHQGKVVWDAEPVRIEGEDFLGEATWTPPAPLSREHQYEHDRAVKWLHDRLRHGRVSAAEIQAEAAKHEIRDASLRRAFRSLGCKTNKEREPKTLTGTGTSDGASPLLRKEREPEDQVRWYWRLPGDGFFFRNQEPRFIAQPVPDPVNRPREGIPKNKEFVS